MLYKEKLHEEISGLIEKIRMDWDRMKTFSPGIHKIDKDIITADIRSLYDLIFEIDFEKSVPKILKFQEPVQPLKNEEEAIGTYFSKKLTPNLNSDPSPISYEARAENASDEIASTNQSKIGFVNQNNDQILKKALKGQKWIDHKEKVIPKPEAAVVPAQLNQHTADTKGTPDLFTAPRTIADVFQDTDDNSLAARMQLNPITDIKTAIGINDKFLFINTIFHGEISAYNKAIDQLNELPTFYQVFHLINDLKAGYGKEDNKESFARLLNIVKRKFQ